MAEDLKRCIAAVTVPVSGKSLRPSASIGVAHIDRHASNKEAVLSRADDAMYAQKRATSGSAQSRSRSGRRARRIRAARYPST